MLVFVKGDMFADRYDIRVNTINCVGVMGSGIALAFKVRYPKMFCAYKNACQAGRIRPGRIDEWRDLTDWIINFPTKRHWRDKSNYEDIASGLDSLREYLQRQGLVRVALPALGCGHGGLDWQRVSAMIRERLTDLDAVVFVFEPTESLLIGEQAESAKKE
jgi:O-acetyl-ADP-ribose deacetylase (regulator of RNase III)